MGMRVRENLELIIMLLESQKRNKKKNSEQPCGIRHVALTLVAVYF